MTNPKIRLFLVLGMAVAMLAAILWVGLILSASPVSADEGTPPDGGTTVDQGTPPDEGTPPAETPPATVQTDKTDYGFYETPLISGGSFAANTEVTITITSPDGTFTTFTATTDADGNWTANYDGPMGSGTFIVTATDGTSTAETTFADPVVIGQIFSSDVSGTPKDTFLTTDTVYVTITTSGSNGANNINIYVVNDGQGTGALTDVSGGAETYSPSVANTTYTYAIWSAPTAGNYDIVVDENQNGWYDWGYGSQDQLDALDWWWGPLAPGFTVTTPTPPTIAGVYSSNSLTWDGEDNSFLTTGNVYAHITTTGGSPGGTISVNIYVTADKTSWALETPLTDVSGGFETVNVPTGGGTYLIWSHFTTAGNYDIVVDVNKDGHYGCPPIPPTNPDVVDSITPVGFTVSKANATIVVTPYNVPYDGNAHTATGTATGAYGENLLGLLTLTGTTHTNAGDYLNDPWSFAGNAVYNSASSTVHDIITPKPASVTPDDNSKTYGDADPVPLTTGTLSGFLPADSVTATYTRTPGETVAGSPYTISATLSPSAVLANYTITYNTANFTITPKAASVTPDDNSKTYGDADPVPLTTGTLTGFLPADGVTATYSRVSGETAGDYTISATLSPSAVLANYDITYNTATFTINKATLTATADDQTITYGDPEPTYTITYSGFVSGDDESDIDTLPIASVSGPHTDAGTYTITCSGGVDNNYDFIYVDGTLTIIPAPLTMAAGATPAYELVIDWFGVIRRYPVTFGGVLLENVRITSPDGTAILVIPVGTLVLDEDGKPLYLHPDADITVTLAGTPTPPEGTTFAAVYEILPNGATFVNGEVELITTYDPTMVPEGSVLVMAYYDEATAQWVEIETAGYVVGGDTVPNTVVSHFAHLTYFALLVKAP